jgi:hypothetical protein
MDKYYGLLIGFIIGTFFGMFALGFLQMIAQGDKKNEKLIMERRGKIGAGKFCKPDDYHSYFRANHRRSFRTISGGKSGKTSSADNRVLHNEHGHLEL